MKNKIIALFIAVAGLLMSGCATSVVSISPSTTPITGSDRYVKLGYAKGSSHSYWLLFFPFGPPQPSRAARDEAIENGGGNALIEVVEEYHVLSLLAFTITKTTVEGTAIKIEHQMADTD
jgi:uncharacterized protein YceK